MSLSLESLGKKYLLLYGLSLVLFFFIAFDYWGGAEASRSTKVAFYMIGAGVLASGTRLIIESVKRRKKKDWNSK